jgi:starch synthase (maltosyl-transferring)
MKASIAKARVVIENIRPCIDHGAFAVKRVPGEILEVRADIFGDGHDVVSALLLFRKKGQRSWQQSVMHEIKNDRRTW